MGFILQKYDADIGIIVIKDHLITCLSKTSLESLRGKQRSHINHGTVKIREMC